MVTLRELGLNARDIQGGKNTRGDEKKTFFPRQMTAHTPTQVKTRGETQEMGISPKKEKMKTCLGISRDSRHFRQPLVR